MLVNHRASYTADVLSGWVRAREKLGKVATGIPPQKLQKVLKGGKGRLQNPRTIATTPLIKFAAAALKERRGNGFRSQRIADMLRKTPKRDKDTYSDQGGEIRVEKRPPSQ